MDFAKLKDRYWETYQFKQRWLGLYKDLYYYVLPNRDAFNVIWNYRDDGKPTTNQIWDDTAVLAAYMRANDLHSLLMPQDRVWGSFSMDKHRFSQAQIDASKGDLDEINENIFFYLNQSNLARAVSASNLDLVGGTAALWVESIDDNTPLYFRSLAGVAIYVEYSTDDLVNTCWYKCKMSGRQILEHFPKYYGNRRGALEEAKNDLFSVIYGQIKYDENSFYIYAVLEDDQEVLLWETQKSYPQILVYRDRVRPGESDGRGIGLDLLPTIRDLNRIVEYRSKNMAFKANPPLFYDTNAYFNPYSVRQWSNALIARMPGGRNPIEAMEMPEYPDVNQTVLDLREFIRTGFMVDPLGEIQSPVRSATEVSIRENRAQRTASTDISRLINELPRQVYEVSAKILSERRLLTRDRKAILNPNGKPLSFKYQSPLYDLQKQDNLNHLVTNLQIKQQFFGQGAAAGSVVLPELNEALTEWLNLPHNIFVSKQQLADTVKKLTTMQSQGALAPPTPSTTAAPVKFPEQGQVTI